MTNMTMAFDGVRELSAEEIEEVNGAWLANAIGGIIGGTAGAAAGWISSGGNLRAAAIGGAVGAGAGIVNPVGGSVGAIRALRAAQVTVVGSAAGFGAAAVTG